MRSDLHLIFLHCVCVCVCVCVCTVVAESVRRWRAGGGTSQEEEPRVTLQTMNDTTQGEGAFYVVSASVPVPPFHRLSSVYSCVGGWGMKTTNSQSLLFFHFHVRPSTSSTLGTTDTQESVAHWEPSGHGAGTLPSQCHLPKPAHSTAELWWWVSPPQEGHTRAHKTMYLLSTLRIAAFSQRSPQKKHKKKKAREQDGGPTHPPIITLDPAPPLLDYSFPTFFKKSWAACSWA